MRLLECSKADRRFVAKSREQENMRYIYIPYIQSLILTFVRWFFFSLVFGKYKTRRSCGYIARIKELLYEYTRSRADVISPSPPPLKYSYAIVSRESEIVFNLCVLLGFVFVFKLEVALRMEIAFLPS